MNFILFFTFITISFSQIINYNTPDCTGAPILQTYSPDGCFKTFTGYGKQMCTSDAYQLMSCTDSACSNCVAQTYTRNKCYSLFSVSVTYDCSSYSQIPSGGIVYQNYDQNDYFCSVPTSRVWSPIGCTYYSGDTRSSNTICQNNNGTLSAITSIYQGNNCDTTKTPDCTWIAGRTGTCYSQTGTKQMLLTCDSYSPILGYGLLILVFLFFSF